ncbi:MAG TPA: TldD/PmbA family protein [Gemmatimonadaceae bacterium]|nr:TldD/PmbA family protein [Gemmatimonadaceae bacterium]
MSVPKRLITPRHIRRSLAANGNVITREEAEAIVARAVGFSKAESVRVTIDSSYQGNVRFAANQMSTSGGVVNANVVIESAFGPKHAAVTTNDFSDASLRRTVEQSEVLARLAPDDPESMPPLGPQQYATVPAWFDSTANLTAEERARAALTALGPARTARDLAAAGYIVTSAQSNAVANKAGQFAYHRSTSANYTLTVRTADGTGSGWAGAEDNDWPKINFGEVSKRAIDKARLSRNPVAVEPGRYTVILEPQAVGDLVQLIAFYGDARSADEGRSPFVKQGGGNKIGEKIVDSRITLLSDPMDPDLLAQPYDGDGLPLGRQVWIENGVLKQLYYSRFWAQKNSKQPTGSPSSLKMLGGTATIDDMIRSTPRGILVTRLWYLREVDPRTILYTGLTRDGTFLIENGKIAKAIRNLRFNESPLFMLNNIEALGRPMRLAGTEAGGAVVMPPIKVRDFTFTSLSEAV